ncbi:MAG: hypothetical protein AMXMBFR84_28580 [Candidatus Hydrogenedentota bacterium]
MLQPFIEPGVPTSVFWIFVGLAIIIQGISKSGFAGGAGILSLPLMMLVMPVDKVAATLLPLLVLLDLNAIYHHRRNKDWRHIRAIYLPSILGILIGAGVWWWIGDQGVNLYGVWIKRFTGFVAILFAVYILAKESALGWVANHKPGRKSAWVAGVAAGFTSTIAHAAGPIVGLYMFAQGMGKSLFVGTVAWTFTLINLTKVPFYVTVNLIDWPVLRFDLFLIPLIPVGSWMGKWMHDRVHERTFNRVIFALTLLAGIQLVSNVNLVLLSLEWLKSFV